MRSDLLIQYTAKVRIPPSGGILRRAEIYQRPAADLEIRSNITPHSKFPYGLRTKPQGVLPLGIQSLLITLVVLYARSISSPGKIPTLSVCVYLGAKRSRYCGSAEIYQEISTDLEIRSTLLTAHRIPVLVCHSGLMLVQITLVVQNKNSISELARYRLWRYAPEF